MCKLGPLKLKYFQNIWVIRILKRQILIALLIILWLTGFCSGLLLEQRIASETQKRLKVYWGDASKLPGVELIGAFQNATNVRVEATFGGAGPLLSALELSKSGDLYLGIGTFNEMEMTLKKNLVDPRSICME